MSAPNKLLLDLRFGIAGRAGALQSGAWSEAEDGHTWALSAGCAIALPIDEDAEDAVVLLDVWPQTAEPERPVRSMAVSRDGRFLAEITVGRRGAYLVALGKVKAGSRVLLGFRFDDAVVCPDDRRPLAFAFRSLRVIARGPAAPLPGGGRAALPFVGWDDAAAMRAAEAAAGAPLKRFLCRFESLGQSCDFGLFQRQCEAEPLGLLRFGSAPTHGLVDGLIERFDLLGAEGTLETVVVAAWNDEYFMYDTSYGLTWHTFLTPAAAAPEQLIARESYRLPFLKRGFLKVLDTAGKIFVLRRSQPIRPDEAEAVAAALRLHADCRMLWAVQDDGQAGSVEVVSPYIVLGHLDVARQLGDATLPAWLSVCVNAAAIFGRQGEGLLP